MSRKTVRIAIATYLQNYGLTYVGTVYPARPTIMTETRYYQTMSGEVIQASANGSVAQLVVNILEDSRVRQADSGRGAVQDLTIHHVGIEIFFASPAGTTAMTAQMDYDQVMQSIFVAIRANATPGGPQNVWSFGEFSAGLQHRQLVPESAGQGLAIVIVGLIEVEAWEWEAGVGV